MEVWAYCTLVVAGLGIMNGPLIEHKGDDCNKICAAEMSKPLVKDWGCHTSRFFHPMSKPERNP